MNIELESKRRTTINSLQAAENLRNIMESSGEDNKDNLEYVRAVEIRSQFIVKLILLYYPYEIGDDIVSIKIDGVIYAIPLSECQKLVDEDVYQQLLDGNYKEPTDANGSNNPIEAAVTSENMAKRICTEEYAFLGLTPGCGTTHSALMYARVLSNTGRTAYVELNGSLDICAYGATDSDKGKITFEVAPSLDAFYGYDYKEFIRSFRDSYAYVVLDFGFIEDEELDDDYIRAQNRFIVSSSAVWSMARIKAFKENPAFNGIKYVYLFPNANKANIKAMKEELKDSLIATIPYCEDPLKISKEVEKQLLPRKSILIEDNQATEDLQIIE